MEDRVKSTGRDFELLPDGSFVIRNYNQKKPFSNFLPGIAGIYGTPMWAFYANRGQAIASFGTQNKDGAILEFYPANKAYQMVTTVGFRTFLKYRSRNAPRDNYLFYEPFRQENALKSQVEQSLIIRSEELMLREQNPRAGLKFDVTYFTIPGEPLALLGRELVIENLSDNPLDVQVLDGLPAVIPFGMNEWLAKNMSRTIEAWMITENRENKAPFFRLRVDAADRPEVVLVRGGHFYFTLVQESSRSPFLADPIVDPEKVFGAARDFVHPQAFDRRSGFVYPKEQTDFNKTPCAFSFANISLKKGRPVSLRTYIGHAENLSALQTYVKRASAKNYYQEKREENRKLIEQVKSPIFTVTGSRAYDLYASQTYLDNVMRGGMPMVIESRSAGKDRARKRLAFYIYSRKHGDLERDYNRFVVEPSYFAQGNGNYRDVNQNRRSDIFFEPRLGDVNVKTFYNLIQMDGFNPLVIKGADFVFKKNPESQRCLVRYVGKRHLADLLELMAKPFKLGSLYRHLEREKILTRAQFEKMLGDLVKYLDVYETAEHGEGYWIDHWTYTLDLLENYLALHPEDYRDILFNRREFSFFDSDHIVRPLRERCILRSGMVRQYGSVVLDGEKAQMIADRTEHRHVVRSRQGKGPLYQTTLFVKQLSLVANKLASLDPFGTAVEMEADKPSWLDALNGLPGLFGSSTPEMFELKRLVAFMLASMSDLGLDLEQTVELPEELFDFVGSLQEIMIQSVKLSQEERSFLVWDKTHRAKEEFRERTRLGVSGRERKTKLAEIKVFLEGARLLIERGLERAYDAKRSLYPTYFENSVTRFETLGTSLSTREAAKAKAHDRPNTIHVIPKKFSQKALPLFLEGPVHAMKVEKDPQARRELLRAVRQSGLYDRELEMYKVNAPLGDTTLEVGRCKVFSPGWLENESVWLHMEYKFLLEMLRAGLAEEFFQDFKKVLIPFQPAERYGRSILENSSFIVSSAFKDPALHGNGFVARLSGSTAEFLSMWILMNIGKRPFVLGPDGKLQLRFEPRLPAYLFTEKEELRTRIDADGLEEHKIKVPKNAIAFLFLGKTLVCYHNPKRLDTFGKLRVVPRKIHLHTAPGKIITFTGDMIPSPWAGRIRDEFISRIDIDLG